MSQLLIQQTIQQLQSDQFVSREQTEKVFNLIMQGEVTPAQVGALLMGFTIRGETAEVVAGAAQAMRSAATHVHPNSTGLLDTCGTGGDAASTFNISTAVSMVVAACGQPVAKHGNRAMSSKSGAADVLEALGVKLELTPEQVAACIDEVGIGFLFAPNLHPAMRHAGPIRRELGIRTLFNILGPLTNPADAEYQLLGVYAEDRLELVADALLKLGTKRALVVHGRDGLDEITTTSITDAFLVEEDRDIEPFEIDPSAFGMPFATPKAIKGGDASYNAEVIKHIFAGQKGAARDIVLLNAGAALWVAQRANSIGDGIAMAAEAIDSGRAEQTLAALIRFTQNQS
ncbi:MAG: anthranilate phosphoribosyltransferase [Mariprofundaceae bacterium]|nr:anthranilate phosphoribosyltransferase [Mariprofundaceae bacterium]